MVTRIFMYAPPSKSTHNSAGIYYISIKANSLMAFPALEKWQRHTDLPIPVTRYMLPFLTMTMMVIWICISQLPSWQKEPLPAWVSVILLLKIMIGYTAMTGMRSLITPYLPMCLKQPVSISMVTGWALL